MSFSLTRKTDYALLALARLEQQNPSCSTPRQSESSSAALGASRSRSARAIADEFHLPLPLLTNILKDLSTAGLIDSRRGAGGGYHLARPASQITLAQVVAAIEGPVALARCCAPGSSQANDHSSDDTCPACQQTPRCPITHSMHQFNDAINAAMRQLTLAQMMQDDLRIALNIQNHSPSHRSLSLAQTV